MVSLFGWLRERLSATAGDVHPPKRLKLLFVGANAIDTSRLDIGAEFRDVQAELERAQRRGEIEVRVELAVSPVDLNRLLLEYEPDVVHFSGHGMVLRADAQGRLRATREFEPLDVEPSAEGAKQGVILLEARDGKSAAVSVEALARLFGILKNQRCIVLNACFSALQAAAITEHVDWVIGMKRAINDESAIVFSVGFYQAIASGRTVEVAFELGCSLVTLCGLPGADIPELFGRSDPEAARLVGKGAFAATSHPLQVSEVHVIPGEGMCTLDFRVYNSGDVDVLINRVSLRAVEVRLFNHGTLGYMAFSHEYDMDITSLEKSGDVVSCNVAQLVGRRGVDRFGIRLSARLPPAKHGSWKLRPSLSTNLGSVEGPVVEQVDLPPKSPRDYLFRDLERAETRAWRHAAPDCLMPYRDIIGGPAADLGAARETLERSYPDSASRCLVLFEWLGNCVGSWKWSDRVSVPESLLLEFPTTTLVDAITTHGLTPPQLHGAIKYFAVWRWRPEKFKEPNFWTEELKDLLLSNCLAAGYDAEQIREVELLFHRTTKSAAPPRKS
ncbi:CHAT domain-containing protein [Polyangium spumosum]|nr:CHAT domain-containing protein [Polyangium spumosum]